MKLAYALVDAHFAVSVVNPIEPQYFSKMRRQHSKTDAIDERVMKRLGCLDSIFIIPETRTVEDAGLMLKKYVGEMWQDDHMAVAEKLVGYPGAFIREVAIYALTQLVNEEEERLTLDRLQNSFIRLQNQIEERDEFVMRRTIGYKI